LIEFTCRHCGKKDYDYPSNKRIYCSTACVSNEKRVHDKEKILCEIIEKASNGIAAPTNEHGGIQRAVNRIFGCWEEACKQAGVKARKNAKAIYEVCQVEGCERKTRGKRSPYCDMHNARLRRNGSFEAKVDTSKHENCLHCGIKLEKKGKYCSVWCAARHYRGTSYERACVECGKTFVSRRKKEVCSSECGRLRDRRYERDYYKLKMETDEEFKEKIRQYEYKRKARKAETAYEGIDRAVVFSRDGWVCQLCGEKIPPKAKWPEPKYGTIDHIIPLSKGGTHTMDNVQAAHLRCNCRKNDRNIMPNKHGQMMLV